MVYSKVEWTDPVSHETARILAFTDGVFVFDAFDGDGEEIITEWFSSFDEAVQRAEGWQRRHRTIDPPFAA